MGFSSSNLQVQVLREQIQVGWFGHSHSIAPSIKPNCAADSESIADTRSYSCTTGVTMMLQGFAEENFMGFNITENYIIWIGGASA